MAERVKEQEFETGFLHGWDGSDCIYYTDEKCLYCNDAEAPCHHCHHYTLEEQKKEAREAAMAAGAEVLGEEWKPGTLENVKRQVENAYTDLKGCGLYKEEKHFRNGMDLMYNNVIDIINSELGRK